MEKEKYFPSNKLIEDCYLSKKKKVKGESFVIDWSLPEYKEVKKEFEELSANLKFILKDEFVQQNNHHSTILSKKLDEMDIPNNEEGEYLRALKWKDEEFVECNKFFESIRDIKFDLIVDKYFIVNLGLIYKYVSY